MSIPLSLCVPENPVSRDGFGSPVPRQPAHLHTQAESGAYLLRDSSRVLRPRPFMKPPYAIGSVRSLSSHAIAYRWRSLPKIRRHRASKFQSSSERVLPWQVTMDQLLCAIITNRKSARSKVNEFKRVQRALTRHKISLGTPEATRRRITLNMKETSIAQHLFRVDMTAHYHEAEISRK